MSTPYCTNLILPLAQSIYADINSPSNQSVGYISGWITSSGGMIAEVNNRLGICVSLSGTQPCLVGFGPAEGALASLIYQSNYYKRQAACVLQGGGEAMWTQLKEGDSTIVRSDMTKVSKEFRELHKSTEEELTAMIHYWTLNRTVPTAIDAQQVGAYPSP